MTQKQQHAISVYKNDAYKKYIEVCIKLKEVPREDIKTLIDGCSNIEALKKTIDIFKSNLE